MNKEVVTAVQKMVEKDPQQKVQTKLVSLPRYFWDEIHKVVKEHGYRIPNRNFTISSFLYGDGFRFKEFVTRVTKKNLYKLTAYCLKRTGIILTKDLDGNLGVFFINRDVVEEISNVYADIELEPHPDIVNDKTQVTEI